MEQRQCLNLFPLAELNCLVQITVGFLYSPRQITSMPQMSMSGSMSVKRVTPTQVKYVSILMKMQQKPI